MSAQVELTKPRTGLQRFLLVWGRIGLTAVALLLQIFVFIVILLWGSEATPWVSAASLLLSLGVLVFILTSKMQIDYKLAWTIPILVAPLFTGAFYLLFGSRTGTRRQVMRSAVIQQTARTDQLSAPGVLRVRAGRQDQDLQELKTAASDLLPVLSVAADAARQIQYLESTGPFVAYRDTETTYYPLGEDAFVAMLEAIEDAKHWVGLEYFIVSDGKMWRQLFEVLARKAAEGVHIWFMYDDLGSIWNLPPRFNRDLTKAGIRVKPVNKLGPGLTLRHNNRDHRKLLVVDGLVGFTGGINIADEYINQIERFGHWKDTAIRLRGPGAWGMATLFFSMWKLVTNEPVDLASLCPPEEDVSALPWGKGLVVNYDDSPFDDHSIGWDAYRNMMTRAHERVDVMTPYLVPTSEMTNVLTSLAQSGLQIRIITPGIPDKRFVYAVTRSNYRALVEAGVEVYEYTPGFMHAKQMIVDNEVAIIGTINFDFRSFYLHQENAVWMYRTPAITAMTTDFEQTLAKSRRITLAEVRSAPWWRRALWTLLRTFSPLM